MDVWQICRGNLLREIHEQVGNSGVCDYMIFYMTSIGDGRRINVSLKTDTDLFRLLVEQKNDPVVYVVVKGKQSAADEHTPTALSPNEEEDEMASSKDDEDDEEQEDELDEQRRAEIFDSLIAEFGGWIRRPGHIDKVIGQRRFSSQPQHNAKPHTQADCDATHEPCKWVIPILDFNSFDSPLPLDWVEPSIAEPGDLKVGSIFRTKDDLAIAVVTYHMENQVEYATDRSSTTRLGYICKHGNGCPFKLRAVQKASIWRVIKLNKTHTCQFDLNRTTSRQVPAQVVGKFFSRRLILHDSITVYS